MNEITLRKDIKLNQQDYDTILATINTKQPVTNCSVEMLN